MNKHHREKLGMLIAALRKNRNVSQKSLAKLVGCSQNQIHILENGDTDPGIFLMASVAKALNMPLAYFTLFIEGQSE